jgi:tRNA (guanine37-N1)-methyltransferase
MKIFVITALPEMIRACISESMFKKASDNGCVSYEVWDIKDFTADKHRQIDDIPYGGGAGMVMKPEPFFRAHDRLKKILNEEKPRVIFPSPQGKLFDHNTSKELAKEKNLTFFCGHYKGIDERVIEDLVTDEISIGDYVLMGGELPALVIIDAIIRHIPKVLHSYESAETDSFADSLLEGPIYTRPKEFRGKSVPEILLTGNHAKIAEWRHKQRLQRTRQRRIDLLSDSREKKGCGGENG